MRIDYDDAKHKYKVDGEPVPSVTQILDVLPKPGLTWWGFRVGMGAAVELCRTNRLNWPSLIGHHDVLQRIIDGDPTEQFAITGKQGQKRTLIEDLAVRHRIHPNAIRDDAADRGDSAHQALGILALGGMPELSDFPAIERPYVQAVVSWWLQQEPEFLLMEQIVASKKYGYAGRFDMLFRLPNGDVVLGDLKTGKDIRPDSHYRQLMGYLIAWAEMGGDPQPTRLQILNARRDGSYVVGEATHRVTERSFLACVAQYKAFKEFDALQKAGRALPPSTGPLVEATVDTSDGPELEAA